MKNRSKRVELIVDLIRNQCISSQEQLAGLLAEAGFKVTQATLSRDLKMLKTTKVATDMGTYMYMLPDTNEVRDKMLATGQSAFTPHGSGGFISLQLSKNIAVVKTRNGYAPGIAYDIDMMNTPEILGTIPGSNTIFVVFAEKVKHERKREILKRILPLDQKVPTY
ncbi:MAG: arginine repressor [Muribaculaceae bacterium]|nr:arginine repressor [Muribaculaceae bacterium]